MKPIVSMFFGILCNCVEGRQERRGCYFCRNRHGGQSNRLVFDNKESPDVGQRGGRSQNTGATVGFAAGGGGSEAPAAYTTDICHLATAVSLSV